MQFTPDTSLEHKVIATIGKISPDDVLIKVTGREEVNLPEHSHGQHQIIYILSGTLHIMVGGTAYFVPGRHLVWIPGMTAHRLSSNNRQISLLIGYFHMDTAKGDRFSIFRPDDMVAWNLQFLSTHDRINRHLTPELFAFADSFFRLLPAVCTESVFPTRPLIMPKDSRLIPILDYMVENLGKDLTVRSVAEKFGFSVRNLTRMFTGAGIGFVQFLNYQRIVRAIEIITDRTMNVEQTAYETGFSSPNSFSRVFRQITGESPSSYMHRIG